MALLTVPATTSPADTARFVRELDRRLERLDRAILIAEWNLETGRSRRGSAPFQLQRARLLSDPRLLSWVRAARSRPHPVHLARTLELLERILLDTQVEQGVEVVRLRSNLQQRIVAYRPRWKGRRVGRGVVWQAARNSPRSAERRRAFYAMEPLHRSLEDGLAELVRLRNDGARALGFRDFPTMRLGFEGLSPERLEKLVDVALARAPENLRALRERVFGARRDPGWQAWDYTYALDQQVPLPPRAFPVRGMLPRILAAVDEWGFRSRRMGFTVVFHDVTSGGLTLAPDPPRDVRIVIHPQGGWLRHLVLFHEVGHAVHSGSIRSPRHLLRWHENVPGFGAFHEGIGGLFEELATNADWLSTRPGIDRGLAERFAAAQRESALGQAAWHAVFNRLELDLYRRPDRDPGEGARRLERRLFGFDEYPPPSFVDSFLVESPVYAVNYFLAELFGAQLSRTLRDVVGEPVWPNARVGPWLTRHWFAPGSTFDWVPRLKEVTGRPFSAESFRDQFR